MIIIQNTETKDTQEQILRQYFDILYPEKLKDTEYIRLVGLHKGENSNDQIVEYVKTFEEYCNFIQTYRWNYDLYNQLSTNNGNDKGKEENQYRRKVLFLDFDLKDYDHLSDAKDFTSFIKNKMSDIFLHACVNSGHGYHYYISIKENSNIEKIISLNKKLAEIFKSDLKATLSTQIARIPCTYNHKLDNGVYDYQNQTEWEYVKVVNNAYKIGRQFKEYSISDIESFIKNYNDKTNSEVKVYDKEEWKDIRGNKEYRYFCIERVKHEGADEGQRNFWHGRIVKSMQKQGYSEDEIYKACKEYNDVCRPPKSQKVIEEDTERFLKKDYNLTGCYGSFPEDDDRHKWIAFQCDEAKCKTYNSGVCIRETDSTNEGKQKRAAGVKINKKILKNNNLRAMSGNDYLVITLIDVYEVLYGRKGFRVRDLIGKLKSKYAKRRCIGDKTLKPLLLKLEEKGWIQIIEDKKKPGVFLDSKLVLARRLKEFQQGYIEFYFNIAMAFIDGRIVANEYLLYITLLRNLDNGYPVSYDDLAHDLNFSKSNVAKYIKNLEDARCIFIEKETTDKGFECNKYHMLNPQTFDEIDMRRKKEFNKASVILTDNDETNRAILIA